jgi:hypothetical protein
MSLMMNGSVRELQLTTVPVTQWNVLRPLRMALATNRSLRILALVNTGCSDDGAKAIAQSLPRCILRSVRLSWNLITSLGAFPTPCP